MIDLDKFIISMINSQKRSGYKPDFHWLGMAMIEALKDQGLEYKDGALVPIEKPSTIKFNEPGIDEMVEDFILSNEASGELKSSDVISYRQGLEDMYRKLKGEQQ